MGTKTRHTEGIANPSVHFACGCLTFGLFLKPINLFECCLKLVNDAIGRLQIEGEVQAYSICQKHRFELGGIYSGLDCESCKVFPLDRDEIDPVGGQHFDIENALAVERRVFFRNTVPLCKNRTGPINYDADLVLMEVF